MTEELKQAAQAALDQLEFLNACYPHKTATDAADALRRALAQRPAAQEEGGPIAASLGDIVAVWDQHAPSEYMTAIHTQAKRALAGQQPMSADMRGWCAYVGGMVAHWITSEPDAHARLGDDRFEAAIAGIIERRIWAMPKPAPQQATPEPVGEPWGYFRALPFGWEQCGEHDDGAVALYTRPAPGVPEGLIEYLRHVRETFANGPMANVPQVRGQIIALDVWIDALAAAQAKGAGHE